MKRYFIPSFYLILPFFVIGSVLMVMDLSLLVQGKDMIYFQYFLLTFVVYIVLKYIIFRKRQVQRIQDDEGKNTYFDSNGKIIRDDEN